MPESTYLPILNSSIYSEYSKSLDNLSNRNSSSPGSSKTYINRRTIKAPHRKDTRGSSYARSSRLRLRDRSILATDHNKNKSDKHRRAPYHNKNLRVNSLNSTSSSNLPPDRLGLDNESVFTIAENAKVITSEKCDKIDELDITGFGPSFHHEGPFDAVSAYNNRNYKIAPLLAFPPDGPNNTIGGYNTQIPLEKSQTDLYYRPRFLYHDESKNKVPNLHYEEKFNSTLNHRETSRSSLVLFFDSRSKCKKVNGPFTAGLGSTTFLDGSPASRNDILKDLDESKPVKTKRLKFFKK